MAMVPPSGQKGQNTSIPDCFESGRFFTAVQSTPDLIDFEEMSRGDSTVRERRQNGKKEEENYKSKCGVDQLSR